MEAILREKNTLQCRPTELTSLAICVRLSGCHRGDSVTQNNTRYMWD